MSALEILCARCACHQKTCCQETEIFVTREDVKRIQQYLGHDEFYGYQKPIDPVYENQHDDPIWMAKAFCPDGSRRVLNHQPGTTDCTFLGPQGCVLPGETRPLVCRLYPFDYTAEGLKPEPAACCPRELLHPGESVFDAVRTSPEDARRWHAMLYQELLLEDGRLMRKNDQCALD